jgi:hypothetical protein
VLLLSNLLVHKRLGEGRLIDFVVTKASVANNIKDDILVEGLTPFNSETASLEDGLGIITVNVEYGGTVALDNVCAVQATTRGRGVGSETDLVVDDNVNGTTSGAHWKTRHVNSLINNTLTSEGSITVNLDGHDLGALTVLHIVLLGTGLTLNDGVNSLKMRGIRNEGQVNLRGIDRGK